MDQTLVRANAGTCRSIFIVADPYSDDGRDEDRHVLRLSLAVRNHIYHYETDAGMHIQVSTVVSKHLPKCVSYH